MAIRGYLEHAPEQAPRFETQLDLCLGRISENPRLYQRVYRDVRRGFISGFPYGVYYRLEGDRVIVIAVAHFMRNPDVWRRRTDS